MKQYTAKLVRRFVESAPDGQSVTRIEIADVIIHTSANLTRCSSQYVIEGDWIVTDVQVKLEER